MLLVKVWCWKGGWAVDDGWKGKSQGSDELREVCAYLEEGVANSGVLDEAVLVEVLNKTPVGAGGTAPRHVDAGMLDRERRARVQW
jgi:hypothetical protein